ncbi:MAG: Tat pathway signal protein [Chloroflexota bacterium]|nr:Tat pathway signal protein [Chloroflexota bacterium]
MDGDGAGTALPWHKRCARWGQTNLTEIDPVRYDAEWWREHWRRTRVQGVIVNAGGIVAYYPSRYPLHHRAQFLGERDLYGEIVAAAREDGLAVLARMDSNRADERFYLEHPDWFAVDAEGRPYKAGDLFIACVNSAYYDEFLPGILREIIERSHPDGFTDNSWSGLERGRICHCGNCQRRFREATGHHLPTSADWDGPPYRAWIRWNYDRRLAVWELNNRVTKEAGGPDCLWIGMIGGDLPAQSSRFRDVKGICERTKIVMLDFQARHQAGGFQENTEAGLLLHDLLGWEKLIPESTAMYGAGRPTFRLGSKPEPEARLWAVAGFAGGIQPWWHHIGAYHDDRRQYHTAGPLFRWHEANEEFLIDRQPVATVGVVWSQENLDFYGRDAAEERVMLPWRGATGALRRARVPFLPIHADHVERDAAALNLAALVLPNVAALSGAQVAAVRRFVERGGGLLATGETSRFDKWGDARPDFALADLFGAHATGAHHGTTGAAERSWEEWAAHTYLRLSPELRAGIDGPRTGDEPPVAGVRHPALADFDETDVVGFAGRLSVVRAAEGAMVPLTYVPPFPIYPPETSWMRHPRTDLPALILNEPPNGGRVAYLAADLDRCYGRDNHPDHARLLANLVRWTARDRVPLAVSGAGLIDCHLYRQPGRLVLHLVNLSHEGAVRGPVHELVPVGPFSVRVRLPEEIAGGTVRLLVAGGTSNATVKDNWESFEIGSIADHEVAVIA